MPQYNISWPSNDKIENEFLKVDFLPAAKIGVKKKTISADSIRPNYFKKEEKPPEASESSSTKEILLGIKDFITAKFKRGVSSFTMKRREKQKRE